MSVSVSISVRVRARARVRFRFRVKFRLLCLYFGAVPIGTLFDLTGYMA